MEPVGETGMFKEYLEKVWREAEEQNRRTIAGLLASGGTLLDLGCDDGSFTERAGREAGAMKLLGVEIDETRARLAEERGVRVTIADLNKEVPIDDGAADTIMANQVIEHLCDTDNMLSESRRILKPGGVLVLSTENLSSWHNVLAVAMGWQPFSLTNISEFRAGIGNPLALHRLEVSGPKPMQHMRVFAARGLVEIIEANGFQVEALVGAGYFPLPPVVATFLNRIDPRHSSFITVRARKTS